MTTPHIEPLSRRETWAIGAVAALALASIAWELFASAGTITLDETQWVCTKTRPVAVTGSSVQGGYTGGKVGAGFTVMEECDTYTRRAAAR